MPNISKTEEATDPRVPVREALVVAGFAVLVALAYAYHVNHIWEDYFITFRHSQNLCEGKGLLYNEGERLHGYTSPIGTLVPAGCHLITGQKGFMRALWAYRAFTILAFAGGAVLLWASFWRWNPADRITRLFVCVFYLTDVKAVEFTTDGMETAFMLLLVSWAVYLFVQGTAKNWLALGLCWGALMWTRPDGCVYIAALALGNLFFGNGSRKAMFIGLAKSALVCTMVYLPWFLWAWNYYGSPVPHTIIAKSNLGDGLATHLKTVLTDLYDKYADAAAGSYLPIYHFFDPVGWLEGEEWTQWYFFSVARWLGWFCTIYWLLPLPDRLGRMASFVYMILCLYLATHQWYFPWYFPPVAFFGTIALVRGCFALGDFASQFFPDDAVYGGGRRLAVFVLLLLLVRQCVLFYETWRQMTVQDRVIEMGHRRQIGQWLKAHVQPKESVYLEPFGYIGYFSGARIVDWPGLVAPDVVRLRRDEKAKMVDAAASLQPDWMVLRPSEIEEMSAATFFQQYALVKVFNAMPKLRESRQEYGHLAGPSWLKFDANLSVFRKVSATAGLYREVPQSIEPTRIGASEGSPTLIYVMPRPTRVVAVRLTFSYEKTKGTAPFNVSWRGTPKDGDDGERYLHWPQIRGPEDQTRLVWLDDTIEVLRIAPDNEASGFRLKELVFLEPRP